MKIATRLKLSALVPAFMALVVGLALLFSGKAMEKAQTEVDSVRRVMGSTNELNDLARHYMLYHEERAKLQFLIEHDAMTKSLSAIKLADGEKERILDAIRHNSESMREAFLKLASNFERSDSVKDSALLREAEERLAGRILVRSSDVHSNVLQLERLTRDEIAVTQGRIRIFIFSLIVLTTLPFTFILIRMMGNITTSLTTLRKGTERIAAGNLSCRLGIATRDEIGELARAFNRMTEQLSDTTVSRDELSREVEERKQAEEELRRNREWLRVTLSSIGDAVMATDTEGRITFFNPVAEKLTGWKLKDASGQPVQDVFRIMNELTGAPGEDIVGRVLREKEIVALANHTALIDRDGREIPIEDSAAPIMDQAGKLSGVVLVFHDVTEKRRAQEALRQKEADLREAQRLSHVGSWHWDAKTDVTTGSDELLRIYGFDPITQLMPDFQKQKGLCYPAEDWEQVNAAAQRTMRSGVGYELDVQAIRDSKPIWVTTRSEVVRDAEGQIVGLRGTVQDITERKQAMEQVESLARFPGENPNPVLRVTDAGTLIYANPGSTLLMESLGWAVGSTLPEKWAALFLSRSKQRQEVACGDTVYCLHFAPVAGAGYVNIYGADITERKQAEEELRQNREWLRVTLSSIGDAVMATDTQGRITFLNPVTEELTGWKLEEALGQPVQSVFRIINEQTRAPAEDIVGRVLREKGIVALANHTALIHRDGREIPIEDSAAPIMDQAGKLSGVVLVFHDVTEQRRSQEALRESEKRVRRKLESVLSPEGDLGVLELADLIEAPALQKLMNDFFAVAHIPMSIIDIKGEVLVGVGWQDICTRFHRMQPDTRRHCIESDTILSAGLAKGECRLYKCKNNMWDMATPIFVAGRHVGNIFTGQFFFEDETVDRELYRTQARKYGFEEEEYLAALDRVPRLSRETIDRGMSFFLKLADMLSQLGYSNVKLARLLAERDRLTDSLRESRATLEAALASMTDAVSISDAEGHFIHFNDTFATFHRFANKDECAKSLAEYTDILDTFTADGEPAPLEQWAVPRALRGETVTNAEYTLRRKDTGETWVGSYSFGPIRDKDGVIVGSVVSGRDITERKRAEEALQKSEFRFKLLSETTGRLLSSENPRRIIEELCRKIMAALDCHAFFNFLVDEESGRLRLNACAGIPEEEAQKIEWLDFGVAVCGCVALEKSRIVAEDIFNVPDPRMELVKANGIQAYACHPLLVGEKLIGTLSFGTRSRSRFLPDELDLMKTVADQVAQAMERIRLIRALEKSRDELELRVQERTAELETTNKTLRDHTERLQRLNQELEQFAWITAHDLQEPLRKIQTFGSRLEREKNLLSNDGREDLRRMILSSHRMACLIRDLKIYSDITWEGRPFEGADLITAVEEAIGDLEIAIQRGKAVVELSKLPLIEVDKTGMRKVFQNLIGNSIKYAKENEKPVVRISGDTLNGMVRIYVEDNGIGFDEQYLDRIFRPFQRLCGRGSRYEGTGMGLAICRKVVEMYGGSITARSTPGEGSTFIISLPLSSNAAASGIDHDL